MEVFPSCHKLVEGALLFDPAVLHYEDLVISFHELLVERVRDDDPCKARKIKNIGRDLVCSLGIQRCSYLVSQPPDKPLPFSPQR